MQSHDLDLIAISRLCLSLHIPSHANILEETQKKWLCHPEEESLPLSHKEEKIVLDWAQDTGFLEQWLPSSKEHDVALIFGSTTYEMQIRLDYLRKLWDTDIRCKQIVWL